MSDESERKPGQGELYQDVDLGKGIKINVFVSGKGDRALFIPHKAINPLLWASCGKPITIVDGEGFMRASDLLEEDPSFQQGLEQIAKQFNASLAPATPDPAPNNGATG